MKDILNPLNNSLYVEIYDFGVIEMLDLNANGIYNTAVDEGLVVNQEYIYQFRIDDATYEDIQRNFTAIGGTVTVNVWWNDAIVPPHFNFEGGNPSDPFWTLYIAEATLNNIDLVAGDEIAIFDGEIMVGAMVLSQVCTPENQFDNVLLAFNTLASGNSGYTPGNPALFKCWDASLEIEISEFEISFDNPYGDAYVGEVFPEGDGQYSIADFDFVTTITQSYSLVYGYQFISSRIIAQDPNMLVICDEILDNLDFIRNTAGGMLRKIGPIWINGIGEWVTTEGYLVRMNDIDEFTIVGDEISPQTPINLNLVTSLLVSCWMNLWMHSLHLMIY